MCESTVDIQSPTAEIRQGKKKEEKEETTKQKYNDCVRRAAKITTGVIAETKCSIYLSVCLCSASCVFIIKPMLLLMQDVTATAKR